MYLTMASYRQCSFSNVFMGELRFVVRPLPSSGLNGAFRVHIAPDALSTLNLAVGDIVQITSEDGLATGFAIAWRATDKMGTSPKVQPAKMTDALREAFGFKQGAHVTITKIKAEIVQADKIVVTDVTPEEYETVDDRRWRIRVHHLLLTCEAFTTGMSFDLSAEKSLRRRFFVERVEPQPAKGKCTLFYCIDDTEIVIQDAASDDSIVSHHDQELRLTTTKIGGLTQQIQELNFRLRQLCFRAKALGRSPKNRGILLHGYEGTGKTLLLSELAENAGFRKAVHVVKHATSAKTDAAIEAAVDDALVNEPSVVVIDELDKLAPADDSSTTPPQLHSALSRVAGAAVLVVAATRSPTSVHSSLLGPGRFNVHVELPIPDSPARVNIMKALLSVASETNDGICSYVGSRTHGFTGQDLATLVETAEDNAFRRYDQEQAEWVKVHSDSLSQRIVVEDAGGVRSTQTTANTSAEQHEPFNYSVCREDFDLALTKIRPTALREIIMETPKVTWNDIGGSQAMRSRFDELVDLQLNNADLADEVGLPPEKGILLYGPPGCSKTLTAQAVASSYDLNFIAVKGAELISMYVGESERAVREVFRKARAAAPSIIFFDEIDSIASQRDEGGAKGLNVLTTLLNEMDGFESLEGVLVLAATNQPQVLDPALLRPGRFSSHIYIGPPSSAAREEILKIATRKVSLHEISLLRLVAATAGYSGAEIVNVCHTSIKIAVHRKLRSAAASGVTVTVDDFEQGLKETTHGITEEMLQEYERFAVRGTR